MARERPVWIVDSPQNSGAIANAWSAGETSDLYEISRNTLPNPNDRLGNLIEILGALDDHAASLAGVVVFGLVDSSRLRSALESEGLEIVAHEGDRIEARMNADKRSQLINRPM